MLLQKGWAISRVFWALNEGHLLGRVAGMMRKAWEGTLDLTLLTLEWRKGGECAGSVVQAEGTAHAKVLGQNQAWHV